jgi:hypothetical protein
MARFEDNVMISFQRVKEDVLALRQTVAVLQQQQQMLTQKLEEYKAQRNASAPRTRTKTVVKRVTKNAPKKKFVAAKTGRTYHVESCPFAKNIKPSNKVTFASAETMKNNGYKPCDCAKRY